MADKVNPRNTRHSFDLDIFQRYLALRGWARQCRAENDRQGYVRATRFADALRDRLFQENRTLLNKLGAKYARKMRSNLEEEDINQVAYLAFMEYLDRYDYSRGLFSTYIDAWIRHEMQQAGRASDSAPAQPRQARMPMPLRKLDDETFTKYGRDATLAEAQARAAEMDPPLEGVTQDALDHWRQSETHVDSLDAPTPFHSHSEDAPQSLHDTVSDPDAFNVEKAMVAEGLSEDLAGAILSLAPLEQRAVKGVFLDEQSKEDVADALGMGPREFDLILSNALAKLRAAVES